MRLGHRHRPPAAGTRARSVSAERGAGLVELSLVALLLFTFVGATFDYGLGWRSGLGVNEGARTAARVGSSAGRDRAADYAALSGMKAALTASGLIDGVERVVVFRASRPDGRVPTVCKTGETSGCNVIDGDDFRTSWEAETVEEATNSNGCLDVYDYRSWCPADRDADQASAEYFGVWLQVRHDYLFPIIGDDTLIERTAVMRIEPEVE